MTDTQAQEAARLAEALNKAAPWADGHVNHEAAALLRSQAARIAELEKAHAIAVEIGAQYAADREALAAQLARMREPLSDDAAYKRGYRDGYEWRHAEVLGALA